MATLVSINKKMTNREYQLERIGCGGDNPDVEKIIDGRVLEQQRQGVNDRVWLKKSNPKFFELVPGAMEEFLKINSDD